MSEHDTPMDDDDRSWCATWSEAAAWATERDIVRYAPMPDLADVLARARALDPSCVPDSWDGAALERELMPPTAPRVVPLAAARAELRARQGEQDPLVAMFAADLRADVEQGLRERGMSEIPSPPRRSRPARFAAVALLAAAALVAWFVTPRLLEQSTDPREVQQASDIEVVPGDAEQLSATDRVPTPPRATAPKPMPTPIATPPIAPPVEPPVEVEPPRAKPRPALDDVEAEAAQAWRDGDLARAERLLLTVVQRGSASRAELAYGDLFAIARQRRGAAGQVAMWRAYLARFPRGRFADDAEAGLCRRADDRAEAEACWAGYAKRRPTGAHVAEAKRWQSAPP